MGKILFIEDEAFLLQGFIDALEDRQHKVEIAKDGEDALDKLNNKDNKYDLLILDIMLPRGIGQAKSFVSEDVKTREMGLEVLRQLRKEDKKVPVIVLTAVSDEDMRMRIIELGVVACLNKPISLKTFLSTVDKALQPKMP